MKTTVTATKTETKTPLYEQQRQIDLVEEREENRKVLIFTIFELAIVAAIILGAYFWFGR